MARIIISLAEIILRSFWVMYVKHLALWLLRVVPQHMDTMILPILSNLPRCLSAVATREAQGMRMTFLEPIELFKCLFKKNFYLFMIVTERGGRAET